MQLLAATDQRARDAGPRARPPHSTHSTHIRAGAQLQPGGPCFPPSPSPQHLRGAAQGAEPQGIDSPCFSVLAQFFPVTSCSALGKLYEPLSAHFSSLKQSEKSLFPKDLVGNICVPSTVPGTQTSNQRLSPSPSTELLFPLEWKSGENSGWKFWFSLYRESSKNISVLYIKGISVTPCEYWSFQNSGS